MRLNIILCFAFISFGTKAQIQFEKRYALNHEYNSLRCVAQNVGNKFLSCGYSFFTSSAINSFVSKAAIYISDSNGDTIKTYTFFKSDTSFHQNFGGGDVEIFHHCLVNKNNEFVAVASIQGHGATNQYDSDIFIVKLDSLGDTLQTKQISHPIPGDSAMIPYFIIQTFDNNYMILDWQNSFTNNKSIGFILKLDQNFNVLWRKSYIKPLKSTYFWKGLEAPDHGVFLSGANYDSNNQIDSDPFLSKIDSAGNILWSTNYTSIGFDGAYNMVNTSDGNFMLATTLHVGPLSNDTINYRLIKFNNNGSIITTKNHLHTYENAVHIAKTNTGNLIISGWINNNNTQTVDAFVMGIDINGDSLWYRQYGGIWPDFAWHMAPTNDGGVILCGETYSNLIPNTNSNAWLVKLDSLGLLITGIKEQAWVSNVQMNTPFPNPCTTEFKITTSIPEPIKNNGLGKTGNELQLYDLSSKPIQYIPIKEGTVTTTFTTANLASGNYLLVLVVNGYNAASQKVVVIR